MFGEDTLFSKQIRDFEAIENDSNKNKVDESYGNAYIEADIEKGVSKEEIIGNIRARYPDIGYKQAQEIYNAVKTGGETDWSVRNEAKTNEREEVKKEDVPNEVTVVVDKYEIARMYNMYKNIHREQLSIEDFAGLCVDNIVGRYCSSEYIKEDDVESFTDFPYDSEIEDESFESKTNEKKKPPVCKKCGKKHWPFQKCKDVKESKTNEQEEVMEGKIVNLLSGSDIQAIKNATNEILQKAENMDTFGDKYEVGTYLIYHTTKMFKNLLQKNVAKDNTDENKEVEEEKVNEQGGGVVGPIELEIEEFDAVVNTLDSFSDISLILGSLEGKANVTAIVMDVEGKRFMGIDPQGFDYARYKTEVCDTEAEVVELARRGEWRRKHTKG